jgi:hypothetical protein
MPSSQNRTQASNNFHLFPKFKEGDIVAFSNWEDYMDEKSPFCSCFRGPSIYKIDCFEQDRGLGWYRCRMWSHKEKKWVNSLSGEMIGHDGRTFFQCYSLLERNMEVIEPLTLLVKHGIG